MKSRLIAFAMLALSFQPTHAQGVTTQGMAADIQMYLKGPNQRPSVMTAARASFAIGLVLGEYVTLEAIAEKEQGHLSCVDDKMDRDKILKDISQDIETDTDISTDPYAGTMEAIIGTYTCLTPRSFTDPTANGKSNGGSN